MESEFPWIVFTKDLDQTPKELAASINKITKSTTKAVFDSWNERGQKITDSHPILYLSHNFGRY